MSKRMSLQQAWDRTHQEQPLIQQPQAEVVHFVEHLCAGLPRGAPALDAGCGRGRNVQYLCRLGFAICGCDLSPVAIGIALQQAELTGVLAHFQVADLTRLPYPDNHFSASICSHVLPYQTRFDIEQSVRELWRVLQPGGSLYLDLLDCADAEYGRGMEIEPHTFLDESQVPIHFCTQDEIEELLNGFRIEREVRLDQGSQRVVWDLWLSKSLSPKIFAHKNATTFDTKTPNATVPS